MSPCKRRKLITHVAVSGNTFGAGEADAIVTAVDVRTIAAVNGFLPMIFLSTGFNTPGRLSSPPSGDDI